jgi:uncharacterized membrane protein YcaP (DUF421 family)
MWQLETPWYELIIRATAIYIFLFILIRIMGKKHLGKLAPFDLIFLLIVSEALQNGLVGDDHGVPAALISVTVLIALNVFMNALTYRFQWLEKLIEGKPEIIILNGKIHKKILKKVKISEGELFEALREHEVMKPEEVKCAILETDGKISVIKYHH